MKAVIDPQAMSFSGVQGTAYAVQEPRETQRHQLPAQAQADLTVEGEVFEILEGYGLAHVSRPDGSSYGLNRQTPGLRFADLREGGRVRMEVTRKFSRVLYAQLLGLTSSSCRTCVRRKRAYP